MTASHPADSSKVPKRGGDRTRAYKSRAVRRAEIVDATLDILAQHGLHAWTTAALAERVGVSEATLFRHFADKEEILTEALRSQASSLREHLRRYEEPNDPTVAIEGLLLHVLGYIERTGGAPLIILSGQAIRMTPAVRRDVHDTLTAARERLAGIWSRALRARRVGKGRHDPAILAEITIAIGQSSALRWLASGRTLPLRETAATMLRVLTESVLGSRRRP
jgi:AcrR family transcriptional regulator